MKNLNRRIFFKHAGTFALGSFLLPACNTPGSKDQSADSTQVEQSSAPMGNLPAIGMQLYSVRDVIEDDLQGTLQQLADMGYKEIESYPGQQGHYFGMEPAEFSTLLSDMGMTLVSSHFGSGTRNSRVDSWRQATMLSRFEELVEKAAEANQQYLTCSSLDASLRQTADDLQRTAELFNQAGQTCKNAGLQFAYHNHAFEYEQIGDMLMFDYLLENTDPDLVKYELDMYWVVAGGQDPVTYLQKYPNRFPLGHVKDMDKEDSERNTEIGKGSIDYTNILKVAKENGMQHFLVEQETYTNSSIESMKENFAYLSKLTV